MDGLVADSTSKADAMEGILESGITIHGSRINNDEVQTSPMIAPTASAAKKTRHSSIY